MADDVKEWKMVDRLKPADLSNIQDKGMKGAVMLAVALGWNLIQRDGAPAQVVSREGIRRNIPTDTGVRQSVFWSLIANVIAHSDGQLPTPELIDLIVKQTGMSKAHAHVLKSKTSLVAAGTEPDGDDQPDEEELGDEGERTEDQPQDDHEQEVSPEAAPEEAIPAPTSANALEDWQFRVEPTLSTGEAGAQYISPVMETVIRRLEIDGEDQITYRCVKCGLEYATKRGAGSHWQTHTKVGDAEPTSKMKKTIVNVIPDYTPTEVHLRGGGAAEIRRLRKIIADVQKAVGQAAIQDAERKVLVAERKVAEMTKQRDDAVARADRLANDLRSLRELITGLKDD